MIDDLEGQVLGEFTEVAGAYRPPATVMAWVMQDCVFNGVSAYGAFDVESGLPVTMLQTKKVKTPWFDFACAYMDMK